MPQLCLERYIPHVVSDGSYIDMRGLSAVNTCFFNALVTVRNVLHNLDPAGLSDLITVPSCPSFLLRSRAGNFNVLSDREIRTAAFVKVTDTWESNVVELHFGYLRNMLRKCDEW
jgi:hypothetical protein